MIKVDPSHFSNVTATVQRTASLTGGAIRGLPNGIVVGGLDGVNSFASSIAEAQKELQLGRIRSSLERVKQLETQFNGLVGRWNATVGGLITNTKQGKQQLSLQKLNDLKNARTRMQQLTGPASKAFRDLVTALDHAVSWEGHEPTDESGDRGSGADGSGADGSGVEGAGVDGSGDSEPPTQPPSTQPADSAGETPEIGQLGRFADNYRYGPRLQLSRGSDGKVRVVPQIEEDSFYFIAGWDPARVVRVRELQAKSVVVFDTHRSTETMIPADQLLELIKTGIWVLQ